MVGLLVKAGNRGLGPLSPSTLGFRMPLPPNPPAQLLEGVGPAGRRQGGHATQNSHCIEGACGLEGQGGGPAGDSTATVRRHARQAGEMGKQRWRLKTVGDRKETLPSCRGEGPPRTSLWAEKEGEGA